ncbi:transposase [uncultured Allobaculum sp.]|uniref:IS66 family transposase n=1 Tax=uncultured Allobaculum sp. TaxID=1187017 RepID=UPI00345D185C
MKDGYFLDGLLGIISLFKEAFSWNQSSLKSISVSISPKLKTSIWLRERLTRVMIESQGGFEEKSAAYRAAKYFMDRVNSLVRYLEDGDYPIDNNVAERAVKPFVINRKNFQTTKSIRRVLKVQKSSQRL